MYVFVTIDILTNVWVEEVTKISVEVVVVDVLANVVIGTLPGV